MTSPINIFIIGATGFIGGAFLQLLLDHPDAADFKITALVRSEDKAKVLRQHGVETVIGSFSDVDKLEQLASQADYVISAASSDDLEPAQAFLRGMKRRYEATGTAPVLIHTSGAAILIDLTAKTNNPNDPPGDDMDIERIDSLPVTRLHRIVDIPIVEADKQGYIRSYIILPTSVYGMNSGALVDQGAVNRFSVQVSLFTKASISRGQAGVLGDGQNIWSTVDIQDLVNLYLILFNAIRQGQDPGHGREGFYFGEGGEVRLYDLCSAIAVALSKRGIGTNSPTPFSHDEMNKYFGGDIFSTICRCTGTRSRSIGWRPVKNTADMLAGVDAEVEAVLSAAQ